MVELTHTSNNKLPMLVMLYETVGEEKVTVMNSVCERKCPVGDRKRRGVTVEGQRDTICKSCHKVSV